MDQSNIIRNTIKAIRRYSKLYPAAALLVALLAGIIIGLDHTSHITGLLLLIFLILCVVILGPKKGLLEGFFALLGLFVVHRMELHEETTRIVGMNGQTAGATARIRVIDTSCGGPELKWLPNPGLIRVKLLNYRLNDGIPRTPVTETKLALRLPKGSILLEYGLELEVQGRFEQPQAVYEVVNNETESKRQLPGFDLKKYLRINGMSAIFRADNVAVKKRGNGVICELMQLRSRLLSHAAAPLPDTADKTMLAALFFGCRQGLDNATKRAFIRSGTIHLFTVSGMHVGMLALLLWLILRPLSFRLRHIVAPLILLIYVLMTGAQPPAIRAFMMIAIWSMFRSFKLRTPILNVVYITALILLIYNPYYIESMGFQFSFIVTGFLLATGRKISKGTGFIGERLRWIPPDRRTVPESLKYKCLRNLSTAVCGCFAAWLAGSAICLYNQGLFVPAAVGANLFIMPLVWLLYPVTFFMTIFSGTGLGTCIGSLTGGIFNLMTSTGEFFQNTAGLFSCPRPAVWSLGIFYLGLLMLALGRSAKVFLSGIGILSAIIIFWQLSYFTQPDRITIFYGGSAETPGVLITSPGSGRAVMMDVPSYDSAITAAAVVREQGLNKLDFIAISGSASEFSAGLARLCERIDVKRIIMRTKIKKRTRLAKFLYGTDEGKLIPLATENINPCQGFKIFLDKNCKSAEYKVLYQTTKIRLLEIPKTGRWKIEISEGGKTRHYELSRSTPMLIEEFNVY